MGCHTLTAASRSPSRRVAAGSNPRPQGQEAHGKEQVSHRRCLVGRADRLHREGGSGGSLVWGAPLMPPSHRPHPGVTPRRSRPCLLSRLSPGRRPSAGCHCPPPSPPPGKSQPSMSAEKGQGHRRSADSGKARPHGAVGRSPDVPSWQEGGRAAPPGSKLVRTGLLPPKPTRCQHRPHVTLPAASGFLSPRLPFAVSLPSPRRNSEKTNVRQVAGARSKGKPGGSDQAVISLGL